MVSAIGTTLLWLSEKENYCQEHSRKKWSDLVLVVSFTRSGCRLVLMRLMSSWQLLKGSWTTGWYLIPSQWVQQTVFLVNKFKMTLMRKHLRSISFTIASSINTGTRNRSRMRICIRGVRESQTPLSTISIPVWITDYQLCRKLYQKRFRPMSTVSIRWLLQSPKDRKPTLLKFSSPLATKMSMVNDALRDFPGGLFPISAKTITLLSREVSCLALFSKV